MAFSAISAIEISLYFASCKSPNALLAYGRRFAWKLLLAKLFDVLHKFSTPIYT
jgi:hypothetical protein